MMLTQTAEMAVLSKAAPPLLADAACSGLPSHSVTKHPRDPSSQHRASLLVGNFHDTLTAAQRALRKGKRPTLHTQQSQEMSGSPAAERWWTLGARGCSRSAPAQWDWPYLVILRYFLVCYLRKECETCSRRVRVGTTAQACVHLPTAFSSF